MLKDQKKVYLDNGFWRKFLYAVAKDVEPLQDIIGISLEYELDRRRIALCTLDTGIDVCNLFKMRILFSLADRDNPHSKDFALVTSYYGDNDWSLEEMLRINHVDPAEGEETEALGTLPGFFGEDYFRIAYHGVFATLMSCNEAERVIKNHLELKNNGVDTDNHSNLFAEALTHVTICNSKKCKTLHKKHREEIEKDYY